ncbi:MAG: insulinase family protein [Firmicutes bacterium]|nr:insulinase family protein [Bacillota bacterium]
MVLEKQLENGLNIIIEEIPYVRSVSFGIWVKNGSANETPAENGASHFIEHMLFKGTTDRTAKDIAEEMDSIGGQINAYTTREYTCFYTRVLDKHAKSAMTVLSDMFFNSLFDNDGINRERSVIGEEIDMYDDAPDEACYDILYDGIWKGSSMSMPILGTRKTIAPFDSEFLKEYMKKQYRCDNTVIAATGNFKADEMLEEIGKMFGGWTSGPKPDKDGKTLPEYKSCALSKKKDIEQVHFVMAFPALKRGSAEKYDLAVLNMAFGGSMSSRLFQRIREDKGLTYSIYSSVSAYEDCGLFSIYAAMNTNQCEEVITSILREIKGLFTDKLDEKTINNTKEQFISNIIMGNENTQNRMMGMGASKLLLGEYKGIEEDIKGIEAVTCESVYRMAEKLFDMDRLSFCAVGNVEGADFESIVKKGKETYFAD